MKIDTTNQKQVVLVAEGTEAEAILQIQVLANPLLESQRDLGTTNLRKVLQEKKDY